MDKLEQALGKIGVYAAACVSFAVIIYIVIVIVLPSNVQPTSPYNFSDPSTMPKSNQGWVESVINIPIAIVSFILSPFLTYLVIKLVQLTDGRRY